MTWVPIPFNKSFSARAKDFDFDINQISYARTRAQAVDFSESYYDVSQALVALKGTPIDRRDLVRRPEGVQARRADRHDQLQVHREQDPARPSSRRSSTDGGRDPARSRTARSTATWPTCRPRSVVDAVRSEGRRGGAVPGRRRPGVLRTRLREGELLRRLREPGDRRLEGRRHARRSISGVAGTSPSRPRDQL